MCRCRARRHQRRADRALANGKFLLNFLQRCQKRFKGSATERLMGSGLLAILKGLQALRFEYALCFIRKNNRVTVKGKTQLVGITGAPALGDQRRRRNTVIECAAHVLGLGGQKQMGTKGSNIRIGAFAAAKCSPFNLELIVLYGIEDP